MTPTRVTHSSYSRRVISDGRALTFALNVVSVKVTTEWNETSEWNIDRSPYRWPLTAIARATVQHPSASTTTQSIRRRFPINVRPPNQIQRHLQPIGPHCIDHSSADDPSTNNRLSQPINYHHRTPIDTFNSNKSLKIEPERNTAGISSLKHPCPTNTAIKATSTRIISLIRDECIHHRMTEAAERKRDTQSEQLRQSTSSLNSIAKSRREIGLNPEAHSIKRPISTTANKEAISTIQTHSLSLSLYIYIYINTVDIYIYNYKEIRKKNVVVGITSSSGPRSSWVSWTTHLTIRNWLDCEENGQNLVRITSQKEGERRKRERKRSRGRSSEGGSQSWMRWISGLNNRIDPVPFRSNSYHYLLSLIIGVFRYSVLQLQYNSLMISIPYIR